jgi:cyclase
MRKIRLIPRLDIKGKNLIKGIQLEGLRVIGDPNEYAKKYYNLGADEIIYMDSVASLYGRNNLGSLIKKTVQDVFVPITVGGGIRSLKDAHEIFQSGADKVAINTAAVKNPNLISDLVQKYGSQSIVVSIEAKK